MLWVFIPHKPAIPISTLREDPTGKDSSALDTSRGNVEFDPKTGNYKIYYEGLRGEKKFYIFEPSTKIKPTIKVKVEYIPTLRSYLYNYEVISSKSSLQDIDGFTLDCLRAPVTNISFRKPDNPSNWWALPALLDEREPTIQWVGFRADKIKPGNTQTGFSFESKGLPGIVDCYLTGYTEMIKLLLYEEPPEVRPNILGNSVRGKTVGPVAVSEKFVPEKFLNNIISLKDESLKLGWIDSRMPSFRLGNRLKAIGEAISEKNIPIAKDLTQSFIEEVESLKDEHLTPEAYYILKFNAQYLLDHLA